MAKTHKKRVALLVSDQHFIVHGGIGQFIKGFVEMCQRLNWKADVILDKSPRDKVLAEILEENGASLKYPMQPATYSKHNGVFAFGDNVNFEKVINFRDSMMFALEKNLYDLVVCNTPESMTAIHSIAISQYIPVVFYTHSEYMVFKDKKHMATTFLPEYHEFFDSHLKFDNVYIGTQTARNEAELLYEYNAVELGMCMPERELLEESTNQKTGVLYIGRWEERKNPKAYIKAMQECGLPCKVMTNETGKKKFVKAFDEAGITDYEIKAGIVGREKVDFIKSCKVHYNPALRESFGFAWLECLSHMPCIALDTQTWTDNFDQTYFTVVKESEAADTIAKAHNFDHWWGIGATEYVKQMDFNAQLQWKEFVNGAKTKQSKTNSASINSHDTVRYDKYIEDLNRNTVARDDVISVLANRHKFNVMYTDSNTWLTKETDFVPDESNNDAPTLEGFFE